MVAQHIIQIVVRAFNHAHRTGYRVVERGFRDRRAVQLHFVDAADVNREGAIRFNLLHQCTIAVVDELSRLAVDGDRDQAVLGVEALGAAKRSTRMG